jgi:hypothetical protein
MGADFGPQTQWPVLWPVDISTVSPTLTGAAVDIATDWLWARTGMRFGTITVTLRPCRDQCRPTSFPGYVWEPWPGVWGVPGSEWGWGAVSASCGSCTPSCYCTSLSQIKLPAPVNTLVSVKLDGVVMTGGYRVDDNRFLVRTDGNTWPYCQNLLVDDTKPGSFAVTAKFGEDVPSGGAAAVGELAAEVLRALGGQDCRLPRNLTSLSRQGVSISVPDFAASLDQYGSLGLYLVDVFVNTWNPSKLRSKPRTWDVDATLARRAGT